MNKLIVTAIALPIVFAASAGPAFAVSTPDFGSCLNPKVAVSQVNTGNNHGVVNKGTYAGTDSIYRLSDANVMQCLCPDNGSGIQTNWYKVSKLSSTDISVLKSEGWIEVTTGASWGLEDTKYLAKNIDYTCKGTQAVSATKPIALAKTGNTVAIVGLFLMGLLSLTTGLLLKKSK